MKLLTVKQILLVSTSHVPQMYEEQNMFTGVRV